MDLGVLLCPVCGRPAEGLQGRVSDKSEALAARISRVKGEVTDEHFENSNNDRI